METISSFAHLGYYYKGGVYEREVNEKEALHYCDFDRNNAPIIISELATMALQCAKERHTMWRYSSHDRSLSLNLAGALFYMFYGWVAAGSLWCARAR